MDNPPPVPSQTLNSSDRLLVVLSHLSALLGVGLLLPLIVYLVKKDDAPAVAAQACEALNFHLSLLLYALACIPLVFVLIGIPLLLGLSVAGLVLAVVAAVRASQNEPWRYPLTLRLVG
jgi:uncharacterized Tic20 family protein